MFSQNSYVEILMPNMKLEAEAFGRCLGHEGKALMNGTNTFIQRDHRELPRFFYYMRTQGEDAGYAPGRWPSPEHK